MVKIRRVVGYLDRRIGEEWLPIAVLLAFIGVFAGISGCGVSMKVVTRLVWVILVVGLTVAASAVYGQTFQSAAPGLKVHDMGTFYIYESVGGGLVVAPKQTTSLPSCR